VAGTVAAAILQFNSQQFVAKVQKAEKAIANRFHELEREKNNEEERRLLFDSLSVLRGVKETGLVLREGSD
jgi:hypothetical protein